MCISSCTIKMCTAAEFYSHNVESVPRSYSSSRDCALHSLTETSSKSMEAQDKQQMSP